MKYLITFLLVAGMIHIPAQSYFNNPVWLQATGPASSGGGGGGGYTYYATSFNGTTDYLERDSAFTGAASSATYTLSLWVKFSSTANNWFFNFQDSGANVILHIGCIFGTGWLLQTTSPGGYWFPTSYSVTTGVWYHLLACQDSASSSACHFTINGTDQGAPSGISGGNILWASTVSNNIMSSAAGTGLMADSLCEVWFAEGQYLDISVAGNAALFSSGGHPISLGSDGSTPTSSAPTIYLKNQYSTFGNNSGTGGNFTIHGSPANDTSIP